MGQIAFKRLSALDRAAPVLRKARLAVAAAWLCWLATAPALAAGDVQRGHELARRWCTGCHVVDPSGEGPDAAPPFPAIAQRHGADHSWVHGWLTAPHPPMPNFNLTRQEIDDVIAYLDSLSPR